MSKSYLQLFFRSFTMLAMLSVATSCASLEDAYDDMLGEEQSSNSSAAKAAEDAQKSAPYQDVKSQPEASVKADEKPQILGSISDKQEPDNSSSNSSSANTSSLANALLTIRFNQPHVKYDDALKDAVSQAEKAKSQVTYDVLSTIPDLSSLTPEQQAKLAARAKNNLQNVVTIMQQAGVSADRIKIAEQTLKIRSQEIRVFVK